MSAPAAAALDSRLQAYEQQTGHQLLVWIGSTTGEDPIDDWAVRAFKAWKVGRKGIDDGLILFMMAQDHKLRIEVGYGLEGVVPDAIASRIINEVIVPEVRAGNPDGAVAAGMEAVASVIGGPPLPGGNTPTRAQGRPSRPMTLGQMILAGIVGLVLLYVFITNPSLVIFLLASSMNGGRRDRGGGGWGGGGGGGFGGGGGGSGGGGASGSW